MLVWVLHVFSQLAGTQGASATPASRPQQERLVVVHVVDGADDAPLVNAEVIDRSTGARALTREQGTARVRVLRADSLALRVRQLGFAFVDLVLRYDELRLAPTDTIHVRLQRVAYALPSVSTTTARDCPAVDASTRPLAIWALGQLREAAERYESFRKSYPFRIVMERRTSRRRGADTTFVLSSQRERGESSQWGDRYEPGQVVRVEPLGYSLPILFIATLGDPRFWDHHCVSRAAVEGDSLVRRVRLRFVPSPSVPGSDWAGDALIDSASSLLQRVEFRLVVAQRQGPRRLEGFTTFRSPSPLIVVPDSTAAIWWHSAPADGEPWGQPNVVQLVRLDTLDVSQGEATIESDGQRVTSGAAGRAVEALSPPRGYTLDLPRPLTSEHPPMRLRHVALYAVLVASPLALSGCFLVAAGAGAAGAIAYTNRGASSSVSGNIDAVFDRSVTAFAAAGVRETGRSTEESGAKRRLTGAKGEQEVIVEMERDGDCDHEGGGHRPQERGRLRQEAGGRRAQPHHRALGPPSSHAWRRAHASPSAAVHVTPATSIEPPVTPRRGDGRRCSNGTRSSRRVAQFGVSARPKMRN